MARVDRDQVRKLGELAHLSLSDEECDRFTHELERILAYAESIQALDTEGVEPTSHALVEDGPEHSGPASPPGLREDEPRTSLDRELVLEAAPDDGDGLFKVPKVLPS
jgi:aspartyl-tRNA(Asn)/glutamyl-tRNA(Gln) amidotransferase subunit C